MNKRLQKKSEKRKRKLIHEMLEIVLDINGLSARKQEITGNLPTAFLDFSGNVAWAEVRIYKNGWFPNADIDAMCTPCTERIGELFDAVRQLKAVKTEIKGDKNGKV